MSPDVEPDALALATAERRDLADLLDTLTEDECRGPCPPKGQLSTA